MFIRHLFMIKWALHKNFLMWLEHFRIFGHLIGPLHVSSFGLSSHLTWRFPTRTSSGLHCLWWVNLLLLDWLGLSSWIGFCLSRTFFICNFMMGWYDLFHGWSIKAGLSIHWDLRWGNHGLNCLLLLILSGQALPILIPIYLHCFTILHGFIPFLEFYILLSPNQKATFIHFLFLSEFSSREHTLKLLHENVELRLWNVPLANSDHSSPTLNCKRVVRVNLKWVLDHDEWTKLGLVVLNIETIVFVSEVGMASAYWNIWHSHLSLMSSANSDRVLIQVGWEGGDMNHPQRVFLSYQRLKHNVVVLRFWTFHLVRVLDIYQRESFTSKSILQSVRVRYFANFTLKSLPEVSLDVFSKLLSLLGLEPSFETLIVKVLHWSTTFTRTQKWVLLSMLSHPTEFTVDLTPILSN